MVDIEQIKNSILQGDALSALRNIPDNSIDTVITSPPYYGLRSYNTMPVVWDDDNSCDHVWEYETKRGISGGTKSKKVQIKGETNFQIVPNTQSATCQKCGAWLGELGQEPNHRLFILHLLYVFIDCARVLKPTGSMWINIADCYFNKSLLGIPDRLKISLIDSGLICRNEIIWHKPNQMPQSVKDRFTNDYEKFYWFTKEGNYYFEQQLEPYSSTVTHKLRNKAQEKYKGTILFSNGGRDYYSQGGRNKRAVWSINTEPQKELHFAAYPKKLIETPIMSTCPEEGVVLDPFFGSGTTGVIAKQLGRNFVGIELNSEYIKIANERLKGNL